MLVLALTLAAAGGEPAEEPLTIATWQGGSLERADYDSWLAYQELEDSPEAIREMAFVLSMAASGRAHGLDRDLRGRLAHESLQQRVLLPALQRHVSAAVTVSDEEVDALRREHPEAFQRPRKLRMHHIYKHLGSGPAADEVRDRMAEIHDQLLDGADFEELARQESESQSRFRDGNLGFLDPDELPPEIGEIVASLAVGQISEPVEHGEGVSIIRVDEIREAKRPGPDEVRQKIHTSLLRQRRQERWAAYQEEMLAAAGARFPATGENAIEMKGYTMSRASFAELAMLRSRGTAVDDLTSDQRAQMLRSWAIGTAGIRRAHELGIDAEPGIAAALRWQEVAAVAQRELVRRVDARLEEPGDAELRRRFEETSTRYRKPTVFDVAAIRFDTGEGEPSADRLRAANEIARRIESGELSFAEAAKRHSTLPSAASGGVLGPLTSQQVGAWGAPATRALRSLEPGQTSGLLHLESGFWIFQLRSRTEPRPMTFDEARERVRNDLRKERIRNLERSIREQQLAAIELVVPDSH